MPATLRWEETPPAAHAVVLAAAQARYNFIGHALQRLYAVDAGAVQSVGASLLATGGAMAVYRMAATLAEGQTHFLICKLPRRRLRNTLGTPSDEEATLALLARLAALAERLSQRAPGLFPRCGGLWHWRDASGEPCCLMVEEFVPGVSVERLILRAEEAWLAGRLDAEAYHRRRTALARLAVASFTRLWDGLDRRLFTADPSPWNVLVRQPEAECPQATIVDLHSLVEGAELGDVLQRLAAVYGLRPETVEEVLLPGILDALGPEAGRALLLAALPRLEAEAAQSRRQLGVDLQQPLLAAIRRLE
ncbi:MAG: hypothetical protein KatS3mg131_1001 [Candidatus Tectimicrobiota bacterium]|nr:MAG: hypothetical protein KatS3mg131_1001 [Candidatus Tectomicrobia bacterium]